MRAKGTVSEPDRKVHDQSERVNAWTPERVTALRSRLDVSQEDFGKLVRRTRQQVSAWENGTAAITRRVAAALEALDHGDDDPTEPQQSGELAGRAQEVEALMAYALERQRLLVQELHRQHRDSVVETATRQLATRPARLSRSAE